MPELSTDLELTYAKKPFTTVLIPTVGTEKQIHITQWATNSFL